MRDPEAYAEHLATFVPCVSCKTRRDPRSGARQMEGCECGNSHCIEGCHENRICCGEGAPVDCPVCGDRPDVQLGYAYSVACANCYDGAPDAGPQLIGSAMRREDAIVAWNEAVQEFGA